MGAEVSINIGLDVGNIVGVLVVGWLLVFSDGLPVGIDNGMCVGAEVGVNVGNIAGVLS